MKLCQPHWAELKNAIEERGLTPFAAADGKEAMGRAVKELREGPSRETFDPLMSAVNVIYGNAIECAGLEIMMPNVDGSEKCPLCYLVANCGCQQLPTPPPVCDFAVWIRHAADGVAAYAKKELNDA